MFKFINETSIIAKYILSTCTSMSNMKRSFPRHASQHNLDEDQSNAMNQIGGVALDPCPFGAQARYPGVFAALIPSHIFISLPSRLMKHSN